MLEKDVTSLTKDVSEIQTITKSLVKTQIEMAASMNTIKYIVGVGIAVTAALAKFF